MAESEDQCIISTSGLQDIRSSMRDEDLDNLTKKGVATREAIRQRLASSGHNLEDLESKNLLVCFLNEEASDYDENEDDEDLDSEDLTDVVDDEGWLPHAKTTGLMCMEKLSSKTLAKNNISKRKGQIIIPLRCAVEFCDSSADETKDEEDNDIGKQGSDQKSFFRSTVSYSDRGKEETARGKMHGREESRKREKKSTDE